ncbi:MAG TPA: hypothetical protein GYA10_07720 [Alphaproteobacteria bacterium]|nr:hypothetical protein [Alphaproteobacteria bacterium]
MNIDQSIFRMAYREAETLGVAQALIARKRQEMELRLLREQVLKGTGASGASIDATLREMEGESRESTRGAADPTGTSVDKTA